MKLPFVRRGVLAGSDRRVEQHIAEAVADTMEYAVPVARLMAVLKHSGCPLVAQLKVAMAQQYANAWAEDLAALEVQ